MNLREKLDAIRTVIQHDVNKRGLAANDKDNLLTATRFDYGEACRSFANVQRATVAIVTGFVIPTVDPPRAETDGPPGALFLARVLHQLGMKVSLVTDRHAAGALKAGVEAAGLSGAISVITLPLTLAAEDIDLFRRSVGPLTHLIAVERVEIGRASCREVV